MAQSKQVDYSIELPDAAAPAKGNAGELTIAAAQTQAQGAAQAGAIGAKATADAISFLGTTAIEGTKGYLEAQEAKEIKATTDKLEGVGPDALAAEQQAKQAQEFLNAGKQANAVDPQFENDMQRLIDAQANGVMTREEVLNRSSAIVKKYSAMMPGFAADFRKTAAEMTGIQHLDVYGIHKALTEKSAREREAERTAQANAEADKKIMDQYGLSRRDQITPSHREDYTRVAILELNAKRTKLNAELVKGTQDEVDKAYHTASLALIATEVEQLGQSITSLATLHSGSSSAALANATQASLNVFDDIAQRKARITRAVISMTQPNESNGAKLSSKYAQEEILAKVLPMFDTYAEAAKNIEGRNMLEALAKQAKTNRETTLNTFYNAQPQISLLQSMGGFSELWKAYVNIGSNDKEAEKQFGKELSRSLRVIRDYRGLETLSNIDAAISKGEDVGSKPGGMDKSMDQVAKANVVMNIKNIAKLTDATEQDKERWTNNVKYLTANLKYGSMSDVKASNEIFGSPDVTRFFSGLSSEQKTRALTPMIEGIGSSSTIILNEVVSRVAKANVEKVAGGFQLTQNPTTGLIELKDVQPDVPADGSRFSGGATGPATFSVEGVRRLYGRRAIQEGPKDPLKFTDRGDVKANLQQDIDKINLSMQVYANGSSLVHGKGAKDIKGVISDLLDGKLALKNTQSNSGYNEEKWLAATAQVESGGNPNANSGKAVGMYQFTEATGRAYGLKIDGQVDERRDPVKSKEAARKLYRDLAGMFNGNLEMMAAGYNTNPKFVQEAINKSKAIGMPDQWKGVLASMHPDFARETVPHIGKVLQAYNSM
jgi:hypothetical protein